MAEIIPREFIDLLLAKVDVVDVVQAHVPLKKKTGSNFFARCPFHTEKSGSFSVSQTKQFYYCFGCGAHGNAIDFLMQHERLSFPEAIETLARQIGMEVPRQAGSAPKRDDSLANLFELMVKVSDYYYEQLRHHQPAIEYLKGRGISGQIAKLFHLGYAPSGWSHLCDHFKDTKRLSDGGLAIKKEEGGYYDRFRDRVMFPIHDHRGRIIGFGGRIIDQGEPKYLNSPETPLFQKGHELYGLYQALKANTKLPCILIVEGYMDVIALFQHGIEYAVATLGTATTAHHIQRLCRYTNEIVFCFDGDNAGRTAAWRALQVLFPLLNDNLQVRFLFLPDGEDPDSCVRKEGKAAFEERVRTSLSLSSFFFNTLSKQSDMNTMEGRARFAASALNFIKQIPGGILPGILLDELGKRARIDTQDLKQQQQSAQPITRANVTPMINANEEAPVKVPPAIRLALTLLVQYPNLATHMKDPFPDAKLPGLALMNQLHEMINKHPSFHTGALVEYWRDQKAGPYLAKLASTDHLIPESELARAFKDALQQCDTLIIELEINRLLSKANAEGLTPEEKSQLTAWIIKKKTIPA